MATRYHITLPIPEQARGDDPDLSFRAVGADRFAEELQKALRDCDLVDCWRAKQPDPEAVDEVLCQTDPLAAVIGEQRHLKIDLTVTTTLPGQVLRERMRWLAGSSWQLRDVTQA